MKKNYFVLALGVVVMGVAEMFFHHSERKDERLLDSIDRLTPEDEKKAECLQAFIEKRNAKAGAKISPSTIGLNFSC